MPTRAHRVSVVATLALVLALSALLHLWGITRDLPHALEVDEAVLFRPAQRIAATGNLNPGWFGYPGSTVIYPLAALLHLQQAATRGGSWLAPNRAIRFAVLSGDFAPYVRTGRLLTSFYGVAAVAVTFWLGTLCFGSRAALVAAAFVALSPLQIQHAQQIRTDSAATLFGLLFLTLAVRLHDAPSVARQVLAGAALGLAVASRYLMASTAPVLLAAQLTVLRGGRGVRDLGIAAAWAAAAIAFVVSTPYLVLDARTVVDGIVEAAKKQSVHVGIENLGFAGNLRYYVTQAIPEAASWPQFVLALAGAASVLRAGRLRTFLLPLYVASFLVGISSLGVHWQRWIIPVLPVVSLFAAHALVRLVDWIWSLAARHARPAPGLVLGALTVLLCLRPAHEAIENSRLAATPSTQIAALEWVAANVPPGSAVAYEWYSAPLAAKRLAPLRLRRLEIYNLSQRPLSSYRDAGFAYLLTSSVIDDRYFREPERFANEVAFYGELEATARLVHEVTASPERRGGTVRIYRLSPD